MFLNSNVLEKIKSQFNTSNKSFLDRAAKYKSSIAEYRFKLNEIIDRDQHEAVNWILIMKDFGLSGSFNYIRPKFIFCRYTFTMFDGNWNG